MSAPIRLVSLASETLRAYPLIKPKTTVGSAPDNDVVIDHKSVSRRHAVIVRVAGGFVVRDQESTNGTRVNGQHTSGVWRLRLGDEVEFGSVRFAVMNSPRRGRQLATWVALAIAFVMMLSGVGVATFLLSHRRNAPAAAPPESVPASAPKTDITPNVAPEHDHATSEAAGVAQWLKMLNAYRAMSGLAPVHEAPDLSAGGLAHARYLVKNSGPMARANKMGAELHREDPDKPWYSTEGARAAQSGDIEQWWGSRPNAQAPPGWAIDDWMASTWHRLWILNPRLREVGYGEYCEKGACVAVLDLLSRLRAGAGFAPAAASAPIQFPPQDATIHLNALGGEWPDPLSACRGYALPAGLPITLQLGAMVPAQLSAYSLRRDTASQILEACGFDALSYANPNSAEQSRGRDILSLLGAAVVIPRQPLAPGNYTVEMTVNGRAYDWHFTVKDAG
jgi:pSer/pThr/pTyr-binding forkhead associated (FHA) protein